VEAVVGIGGPIAGTVAALAVYALYLQFPDGSGLARLTKLLAYVGFLLNLFNLLPVPPLDGGRITAAVSPKVWMLGIAGLIGLAVQAWVAGNTPQFSMLLLVLLFAYPRVRVTLSRRKNDDPYYAISRRASWTIGLLYVALGALLIAMWQLTNDALTMT
jgi:Zn-dependent protease